MGAIRDAFVNLHNHSDYSLLDGYASVGEYVDRAAELGQTAIGLTDHGSLGGLYGFMAACMDKGIKPVPGIEAYVAPLGPEGARVHHPVYYGEGGRKSASGNDVSGNGSYLHLTMWAYNDVGYHNLIKMSSISWREENYYMKPRIDQSLLREHAEGIIATTGCPSGEVPTRLLLGQKRKAYEYAEWMKSLFDGRYYVEIMDHHMRGDLERRLLPKLLQLSRDLHLPLVATNDCHYALAGDARHQEEMLCSQSRSNMDEPDYQHGGRRFAFDGRDYYLKTEEQMRALFPDDDFPGAVDNTREIAGAVEVIPYLKEKATDAVNSAVEAWRPETVDVHVAARYSDDPSVYRTDRLDPGTSVGSPAPAGTGPGNVLELANRYGDSTPDDSTLDLLRNYGKPVFDVLTGKRDKSELLFDKNGGGICLHLKDGLRPIIEIPDGYTERTWFMKQINDGFQRKRIDAGADDATLIESKKRVAHEFPVFANNNFIQYMLVVQDYIKWARDNGIIVGYGRGSVGGSEIAYLMDISDTDPIRHDLMFERFLNPERLSPPDVDTDFQASRRDEVLQYVIRKYGRAEISNIGTYLMFKSRLAFKDMAKIYNMPFSESNRVAAMIPSKAKTIKSLFDEDNPLYIEATDFREAVADPKWKRTLEAAEALEGRRKGPSSHACGVIMSDRDVTDTAPIQRRTREGAPWGEWNTQWGYAACEALGLIKMDFLSLSDLDIVSKALANIRRLTGHDLDVNSIVHGPMDDPETYEMLGRGETIGVFQCSSAGVQELFRRMQPKTFEDVMASIALYRPGPMGMDAHTKYADRRAGREKVDYIDPAFDDSPVRDLLEPSLGLLLYQEQVMLISMRLADFTLGDADALRKGMGHKIPQVIAEMGDKFRRNAIGNGYPKAAVEKLWTYMANFGEYGFNKSHSASYATITYETAYLKCHYPAEFMAALIDDKIGNKDAVNVLIKESRRMGLEIGQVDANASDVGVSAVKKTRDGDPDIRFGFASVSGISPTVAQLVVDARNTHDGPWTDFDDMMKSLPPEAINRKVIENLAQAGAFDTFGVTRRSICTMSDEIVKFYRAASTNKARGQNSLFDMLDPTNAVNRLEIRNLPEWPFIEKLKKEREMIGLYVSGRPLDNLGPAERALDDSIANCGYTSVSVSQLVKQMGSMGSGRGGRGQTVAVIGMLTDATTKRTKTGAQLLVGSLEDRTARIEFFMPPESFEEMRKEGFGSDTPIPESDYVYEFRGYVRNGWRGPEFDLTYMRRLDLTDQGALPLTINITEQQEKAIPRIKDKLSEYPGDTPVICEVRHGDDEDGYTSRMDIGVNVDYEGHRLDIDNIIGTTHIGPWRPAKDIRNDYAG